MGKASRDRRRAGVTVARLEHLATLAMLRLGPDNSHPDFRSGYLQGCAHKLITDGEWENEKIIEALVYEWRRVRVVGL